MREVRVELPGRGYDIVVGRGLLGGLGACLNALGPWGAVAVVSDETVWGLYGNAAGRALDAAGLAWAPVVVAPGEASKSLAGLAGVYEALCALPLRRDGLVLALGGGVVGDLAGFAAATYMRGVAFVQVPTTLLAQVDSSVGGKTAVNLPGGKNLAGAFYQPRLVLADLDTLGTLPPRERACGMAEVVKYGAILSRELFDRLKAPPSGEALEEVVTWCCRLKRDVVQRDERDTGERALLNFGHTLGHAVEALGGFARHNHGEAVAIGMLLAARLGEALGHTRPGTAEALRERLICYGLPVDCPYPAEALLGQVSLDKKAGAAGVQFVLLRGLGEAFVQPLGFDELAAALKGVMT